jgi:type I site-specific restriction-modification system R (restriction) subunit
LGVHRILERLRRIERIGELREEYEQQIERLKRISYRTEDYQEQLRKAFQSRVQDLLELTIKRAEERMLRQHDFGTLEKTFHELLTRVEENSTQEEQIQLVRDLYEFNRDRLSNQRLDDVKRKVRACASRGRLKVLWDEIRLELIKNRRHLGPEFESAVTKHFDEQLARLPAT